MLIFDFHPQLSAFICVRKKGCCFVCSCPPVSVANRKFKAVKAFVFQGEIRCYPILFSIAILFDIFPISVYVLVMIKSFRCKETARLFDDTAVRRFNAIERVARRKLLILHRSKELNDLRSPPGNRLEALKGDRSGQYSIRVNGQWRICFCWKNGDATDVEIVDYHT